MPVNKCLFTLFGLLPPFAKMGIFLTAIKTKCQQHHHLQDGPCALTAGPFA
jgi:hypothetical protein